LADPLADRGTGDDVTEPGSRLGYVNGQRVRSRTVTYCAWRYARCPPMALRAMSADRAGNLVAKVSTQPRAKPVDLYAAAHTIRLATPESAEMSAWHPRMMMPGSEYVCRIS
jgi:hypothetical protein